MSADRARTNAPRRRGPTALAVLLALVAAVMSVVGPSSPVAAHTGFESSTPAQGEVLAAPVSEVTIRFTGPATPAGDEFQALDGDGTLREPTTVTATDDRTFVLAFEPPLAGGTVGIRWSVAAPDTHPIAGSFSFTVDAPAPTTAPPATTVPATEPVTQPAGTAAPADAESAPTTTATTVAPPTTASAADEGSAAADVGAPGGGAGDGGAGDDGAVATTSLDEFLTVDSSVPGEGTARIGRIIGFIGVALALGGLAFAATTFRGAREEVGTVLRGVHVAGLVLAVGAVVEYVGVARVIDEAVTGAWSTEPGFAAILRVLGGAAITFGIVATVRGSGPLRRRTAARPLSAAPVADSGVDEAVAGVPVGDQVVPDRARWAADRSSGLAALGVVAVLASFWFDGHTVSKGVRPLHALVNSVHVAAGSVWVGGVVALASVAWWRHRSGRSPRLAAMVVRFSSIAALSLGAVVVAGVVMAVIVLDSVGELTSTQWGQTLLLKTAAVALAALGGAYNHFRLVPRLEADPDSPELQAELRSTVTAEAIVLVFVVVVTAWLVVAAS